MVSLSFAAILVSYPCFQTKRLKNTGFVVDFLKLKTAEPNLALPSLTNCIAITKRPALLKVKGVSLILDRVVKHLRHTLFIPGYS